MMIMLIIIRNCIHFNWLKLHTVILDRHGYKNAVKTEVDIFFLMVHSVQNVSNAGKLSVECQHLL